MLAMKGEKKGYLLRERVDECPCFHLREEIDIRRNLVLLEKQKLEGDAMKTNLKILKKKLENVFSS